VVSRELKPYVFLAVAILGYSLEPIALKSVVGTLSTYQISFWLCLFASIAMGAVVVFEKRTRLLLSYSKRDIFKIIAIGTLGMTIFNVLITYGFRFLPVGEANSLKYMWPVLLAFISVPLLKERLSVTKLIGGILGLIGVFVLLNGGLISAFSIEHPDAVGAVLAAAVCWALFNALQKQQNYESFTSVFLMSVFSLMVFAPFVLANPPFVVPNLQQLLAVAYLGIIPFGISLAFYFKALQTGDTIRIAALSYITPFLSLAWASLLLGETIFWYYPIALGFVVLGAIIQINFNSNSQPCAIRQTSFTSEGLYDITPLFSGTRSATVYAAMKGGGNVLAARVPTQSITNGPFLATPSCRLIFTDSDPPEDLSHEELNVARETLQVVDGETIIFAVGDGAEASMALKNIKQK